MKTSWTDRRKEFRYKDTLFSADGTRLKSAGIEYQERPFSDRASQQFRWFLLAVLAFIFPDIPLPTEHQGISEHSLYRRLQALRSGGTQ